MKQVIINLLEYHRRRNIQGSDDSEGNIHIDTVEDAIKDMIDDVEVLIEKRINSAVDDFYTLNPKYRTKEKLKELLNNE